MQWLNFLLGIVVVEIATIIFVLLYGDDLAQNDTLRLAMPLLFVALLVAFWFRWLCAYSSKEAQEKIKEKFLKERENLKVNAQKSQTKIIKQAQQDIAREAKITHAKANFKLGMAFAGVIAVGGLFFVAQMFTVGLMMLSSGGGAIGGYWLRNRQIAHKNTKTLEAQIVKVD